MSGNYANTGGNSGLLIPLSVDAHTSSKQKSKRDPYRNLKLDRSVRDLDLYQQTFQVSFPRNYFGLPIYSLQQNPVALVYQCRRPLLKEDEDQSEERLAAQTTEKSDFSSRGKGLQEGNSHARTSDENNYVAQRKVSEALLTMARNKQMAVHFLHKGGLDAVIRLCSDSRDVLVLSTCADCLFEISKDFGNNPVLVEKGITTSLSNLLEIQDENIRHTVACVIGNLSSCEGLEDQLAMNSVLAMLQSCMAHTHHRLDSLSFLLLSLCNVCGAFSGQDAELALRLCLQTSKKLESAKYVGRSTFISEVLVNFSRVNVYNSLMCDEGALPLLLHLMDSNYRNDSVLWRTTETIANFSMNRKNRREIAGSGIANRLTNIFESGSSASKSNTLLIMGNLLSSGMFHDKVAHEDTISNILDNLLDLNQPKQFTAVSYCICQLSKVTTSCDVLIKCKVVPIVLGFLRQAPQHSLDFLWTVLVNISAHPEYFDNLTEDLSFLLTELFEEVRFDASTMHQVQAVVQISLNLSRNSKLVLHMTPTLVEKFVQTQKTIFSSLRSSNEIRHAVLVALINFSYFCPTARSQILGQDLIDAFQEVGISDEKMNVKYIALLNIVSNEENCCYRLLDLGAQSFIVSLQDSFVQLTKASTALNSSSKGRKKRSGGQSCPNEYGDASSAADAASVMTQESVKLQSEKEDPAQALLEGEEGLDLSAATLHNLALKRATLSPGVLLTLLSLAKNTKELRVLHVSRALAHMSKHQKSKIALCKEAMRIIPLLTVLMRCGCKEAEKVQHYGAVVICNILSMNLNKESLKNLLKTGAVVDLVVVTLLRINSHVTKESLGKAFFNLLAVPDIRQSLVMNLDLIASVMELSKVEYVHILELCVRIVFNLSCELKSGSGCENDFAAKFIQLKVPFFVISKLNYAPDVPGSLSNKHVRMLLGMALANMSFNRNILQDLTRSFAAKLAMDSRNSSSESTATSTSNGSSTVHNRNITLAQALNRVYKLDTEESQYCAAATLHNLSTVPECRVLSSDNKSVLLLVDVLNNPTSSILCIKLSVAALCNMSNMTEFHPLLSKSEVMHSLVKVLCAPQLHVSVKIDAMQAVYNLVTQFSPARAVFIENDGITAIWKLLKVPGGGGSMATAAALSGNADSKAAAEGTASTKDFNEISCGEDAKDGEGVTAPQQMLSEESVLLIISHTVKELCSEIKSSLKMEKKAMGDGVMNVILKLSKIESPVIKLDMSFAIYEMTHGIEVMKVLKWDAVDILFWLTIHDTLNMHNTIMRNVSRSLRSFSITTEESRVLLKQERFFPVFKALVKSKNEDVLWQTIGVLYSMMKVESNVKFLLPRGLVAFIFEIASSGFESVKHICSACLHMIPDNMPNMEDPLVLELVLALLHAEGDKFSEISEKPNDLLPYSNLVDTYYAGSLFRHQWTNFVATWASLTCSVDSLFSSALLYRPDENISINLVETPLDASTVTVGEHQKVLSSQFDEFVASNQVLSSSLQSAASSPLFVINSAQNKLTTQNHHQSTTAVEHDIFISTPQLRPIAIDPHDEDEYFDDEYYQDDEENEYTDDFDHTSLPDVTQQQGKEKSGLSATFPLPQQTAIAKPPLSATSGGRGGSKGSGGIRKSNVTTLPLILRSANIPSNSVELLQKSAATKSGSGDSRSRKSGMSHSQSSASEKGGKGKSVVLEGVSQQSSMSSIVSFNEHGNQSRLRVL